MDYAEKFYAQLKEMDIRVNIPRKSVKLGNAIREDSRNAESLSFILNFCE